MRLVNFNKPIDESINNSFVEENVLQKNETNIISSEIDKNSNNEKTSHLFNNILKNNSENSTFIQHNQNFKDNLKQFLTNSINKTKDIANKIADFKNPSKSVQTEKKVLDFLEKINYNSPPEFFDTKTGKNIILSGHQKQRLDKLDTSIIIIATGKDGLKKVSEEHAEAYQRANPNVPINVIKKEVYAHLSKELVKRYIALNPIKEEKTEERSREELIQRVKPIIINKDNPAKESKEKNEKTEEKQKELEFDTLKDARSLEKKMQVKEIVKEEAAKEKAKKIEEFFQERIKNDHQKMESKHELNNKYYTHLEFEKEEKALRIKSEVKSQSNKGKLGLKSPNAENKTFFISNTYELIDNVQKITIHEMFIETINPPQQT